MPKVNFQVGPVASGDIPRLVELFNSARNSADCYPQEEMSLKDFKNLVEGEIILVAKGEPGIMGFVSVFEAERCQSIHWPR